MHNVEPDTTLAQRDKIIITYPRAVNLVAVSLVVIIVVWSAQNIKNVREIKDMRFRDPGSKRRTKCE